MKATLNAGCTRFCGVHRVLGVGLEGLVCRG